jgi:hypothetical protein
MAKKEEKTQHISVQLIMVHHEKICRSFLSIADELDWAKKPFHATVPLMCSTVGELIYRNSFFCWFQDTAIR